MEVNRTQNAILNQESYLKNFQNQAKELRKYYPERYRSKRGWYLSMFRQIRERIKDLNEYMKFAQWADEGPLPF
jgi:hypothetical protein